MPWTYIFRSLINPIGFVVIWSTIFRLYGAGLGFRNPNLNLNCYVTILTPKLPSSNTSFIVFFPICTWIISIWLSIVTIVVFTSGTKEPTCFSMVFLLTFWIFSSFNFCQRYLFSSWTILSNCPKFKVKLLTSTYQYLKKSLLLWSISLMNSLLPEMYVYPQE